MRFIVRLCVLMLLWLGDTAQTESATDDDKRDRFEPTVLVAVLVRNKAHFLPWFLGQLEKLNYPKDRIGLWIRSDHNSDNSTAIVKEWLQAVESQYHSVDFDSDDTHEAYQDERGPCDWSDDRFDHVIKLRELALETARDVWADYILMLDADVMLENKETLHLLIQQQKTIVAPMLKPVVGETYSNFWGGVDDEGYYKRIPEYFDIISEETTGCFPVAVVHTMFLIDLGDSITKHLSFLPPADFDKAVDDIVIFSQSAIALDLPMHILNTEYFGFVINPLDWYHTLEHEKEMFIYVRNEVLDNDNPDMSPGIDYIVDGRGLIPSPHVSPPPLPSKDRLGYDEVYMINLQRRPERRNRMQYVFDLLGIDAVWTPAVDGKELNDTYVEKLNIHQLEEFSDPYTDRPMTMGEIGCFLSHYDIWLDVLKNNYKSVLVFEDDLHFKPYFRSKLKSLMSEVETVAPDWDLVYLGRKRLNSKDEKFATDSGSLVWPHYSYWTLSYVLSDRGARKLVEQRPLQKMIPVDEYLPVMFDSHPEDSWKEHFSPRNLVALSVNPFLIYPTHYTGEANYISDTEDSDPIGSGDHEPDEETFDTMKGAKEGHINKGILDGDDKLNKDEL